MSDSNNQVDETVEEIRRIRDIVLLLRDRCTGDDTFAPVLVAQQVTGRSKYWRGIMPQVREQIIYLARQGMVGLYRNGQPVKIASLRGVYRVGLPGGRSARVLPEEAASEQPAAVAVTA